MSSPRKSTVLLQHHLKQLKLPTMLKEYPLLAKSCSQEKCDYPTYLLRLCEKELADRQRRAMDRRIKSAKFPLLKTIDSFDFALQKSVNEPLVRELLCCEFVDHLFGAELGGGVEVYADEFSFALRHVLRK